MKREVDVKSVRNAATSAALLPDGKHLVCVAGGGVVAWDFAGRVTKTYRKPTSWGAGALRVTATGRVIAQTARVIRGWRWKTGKPEVELTPPAGYHHLLSVSGDGRYALTRSYAPTKNKSFTVWDLERKREVVAFAEKKSFVIGAALAVDASIVVHAGTDGIVRFFDVASGKHFARSPGKGWVDVVERSDDGRLFASGGRGGVVFLWRPDGSVHRKVRYATQVAGLTLSPDARWMVAYGSRGFPVMWDVESGDQVAVIDVHDKGGVRCVRFSLDSTRLVTVGNDYRVCVSLLRS